MASKKTKTSSKDELKTNYNRAFRFIKHGDNGTVADLLFSKVCKSTKDTQKSIEFRLAGNAFFKKKNFNAALLKFKQSIRYGRCDDVDDPLNEATGSTLSTAYFNRATLFSYSKKYKFCIQDFEMALETGYPLDLQHNLHMSIAQTHQLMNQMGLVIQSYERALDSFDKHSKLDPVRKSCFSEEVRSIINDLKKKFPEPVIPTPDGFEEIKLLNNYKRMTNSPCNCLTRPTCLNVYCTLYQNVEFRMTENRGRGLFAKRAFKKDDCIFNDKAWAGLLSLNQLERRCEFCLQDLDAYYIGCKDCSEVFYCNKLCKDRAWEKYHKFECGYISILWDFKNSCRMSYRIIAQTPWDYIKKVMSECQSEAQSIRSPASGDGKLAGFKDGVYQAQDYYAIYNLEPRVATDDVFTDDEMRAYVCCFEMLLLYEKKMELLGLNAAISAENSYGLEMYDERALRLSVITSHFAQCSMYNMVVPYNGFVEPETEEDRANHLKNRTAARVFPVTAMVNHDCGSNAYEHYPPLADYMAICASRDIKAGDEITLNYLGDGVEFNGENLYFICQCNACVSKSGVHLDELYQIYPYQVVFCEFCCKKLPDNCSKWTFMCKQCFKTVDQEHILAVTKINEEYHKARDLIHMMRMDESKRAVRVLTKCIELRSAIPMDCYFSSLVFMSWASIGMLSDTEHVAKPTEAARYLRMVIEMCDKQPKVEIYIKKNFIMYRFSSALYVEYEREKSCGNRKYVKKVARELQAVLKRLLDEYEPELDLDTIVFARTTLTKLKRDVK